MFLFQAITFSPNKSTGPLVSEISGLKDQFYSLYRNGQQSNQQELSKFAASVSGVISGDNFKTGSAGYQEAVAFCSAWANWLRAQNVDVSSFRAKLVSPDALELKKAENYIACVQTYKLGQAVINQLVEAQNALLANTATRQTGTNITIGRDKRENLGYFLRDLLADPSYGFTIQSYENTLRRLADSLGEDADPKKKEILEYIQTNKYDVLAAYLIDPKGKFADDKYSFKQFKEFCAAVDGLVENKGERYVDVGKSKYAISFRLSLRSAGVISPFTVQPGQTYNARDEGSFGGTSYLTEVAIQLTDAGSVPINLQRAYLDSRKTHETESNTGGTYTGSKHEMKYGKHFKTGDGDSRLNAGFVISEQKIKPLAKAFGIDYDKAVKDMQAKYLSLARYDDLSVFLASQQGQKFVEMCNNKNLTFKLQGTATMEILFTGKNIEDFLGEAENNYQLALRRANNGVEYLNDVKTEVLAISKVIGSDLYFIKYEGEGKVYFFQDGVPTNDVMGLYKRSNYFAKFLKTNNITGIKDINALLSERYGFKKDEAAENFNNFMHDLKDQIANNSRGKGYAKDAQKLYDKLMEVVNYDQVADRYTMKTDAKSTLLLHDYFLTNSHENGMRNESKKNAFVVAETMRGGRAIGISLSGDYGLKISITQPQNNEAALFLRYGVNGIPLVPTLGENGNMSMNVFFYGTLTGGTTAAPEKPGAYIVPLEAVQPTNKTDQAGNYIFTIKPTYLINSETQEKVPLPEGAVLDGRFVAYAETTEGLRTKPVWDTQTRPEPPPPPIITHPPVEIPMPERTTQVRYPIEVNTSQMLLNNNNSSSTYDTYGTQLLGDMSRSLSEYQKALNNRIANPEQFLSSWKLQFYQQALGIDGGPWLAAFNNDQTRMRNFFDLMSQGQFQDAWNLLDKNSDLYKNSTLTQGKIVLNDFSDLSKYLKFMVMSHQIDFTTGLYKVDQNNNLLVNVGLRHDEGSVTFFGDETKFKMNSPNMSFIWFNVPADMVVSLGGTVNFMGEFSPVKQKTSSRASVYLDAAKRFTLAENLLDATAQLGGQYNINTPNPWNARMLLRSDLRLADPLSLYATTGWNLSGPSLKQTTFRYGAGAKYTPFVKQESAWKDLNISIGVEAGQYTEYKVGIGVPLNLLFGGGKLNYSATRQSR